MHRFFNPRSLRFKFSVTSGIVFLVIFAAASFVLIKQNSDFERKSLLARANTFAVLATKPLGDAYNLYFDSGNFKFREIVRDTLDLNDTVPRVQLVSVEGKILYDSQFADIVERTSELSSVEDPQVLQAVVGDKEVQITNETGEISELIIPYSDSFGLRPFSLRYFISYESIYANIDRAIQTTIILIIALFVVTLTTITLLVNRSILSPLNKIVDIARQIREGDLNKSIEVNTKDELNDLAISLNQMTGSLRKNIEDLKQVDKLKDEFILIASHNLRTPLTVIKGFLPFLKEKKFDKDTMELVNGIDSSAQKLEAITESLLNIVSIEGQKEPLKKTAEDLSQIIKDINQTLKEAAEKKKVTVNTILPENIVTVEVDKGRVKQALEGILDNAIKFNKEGGRVEIKLELKDNQAHITISDTGVGISEEEQQKIFQKFHRGTDVLTYNYEGVGLGLYVSKMIFESHQGRIWVESKLGEGTIVHVTLPLKA